ncbi:MAG: DUF6599 family protein [Acidobacteriota bacterium]
MRPVRSLLGSLLLLAPLVGIVVWVGHRATVQREDPADVLAALRRAHGPTLPEATAAGAVSAAPFEHYDRDSLYEYIDGAAEAYLARGFESCVVTTYTFSTEGREFEVAAESYRFSNPQGASAQAEAERPAAASPLDGATWTDGSVLLAVGARDLLKLTLLAAAPDGRAALARVAAAWKHEGS